MNRSDICPSCKKQLRWSPPDRMGFDAGFYYCPKCKYKRYEGFERRPWNMRVRKGKRG